MSSPGHHGAGYSKLAVCILGTDGEVLQRDSSKAESDEFRVNSFAFGNSPFVWGTLLDEKGDRFILQVPRSEWRSPPAWWVYRLTTGEYIETVLPDLPAAAVQRPGELGLEIVVKVERVPETPFVVVHSYIDDGSDGPQGRSARVAVVGLDGKQLWVRDFPKEYVAEREFWFTNAIEQLSEQLFAEPGSFSFSSFHSGQRLSFSVALDSDSDSGWRVIETGRASVSHVTLVKEPLRAKVETVTLEELEPIRLRQPSGKGHPIANISDFVIDGDGCFGFVGWSSLGASRFIRVAPDGTVLADIALDELPDSNAKNRHLSPTLNGRWFIIQNSSGKRPPTRAWVLDPPTSELVELEHFSSSRIHSVAPTEDGGFIALSTTGQYSLGAETVERFDQHGKSIWKRDSRDIEAHLSFDAITWLPGMGAVAMTGKGRSSLTYFSLTGEAEEPIELPELLERKLEYPSGLRAGRDGGVLVYDFEGEPSCFVIDSERKGLDAWTPRLEDGRSIPIAGDIQTAPDGSYWTSDGRAFLRLNDKGVIDKVVRPLATGGDGGYEIIRTVDTKGQIYTFNHIAAEVRVYSSDGSYLHACKTESADYKIRIEIRGISVDGRGNVYAHLNNSFVDDGPEYLIFSPTGERIGWKGIDVDCTSENWLRKTAAGGMWVLGYDEIFLLDENDQVLKTILKRANGDWLQYTRNGAVGADDSLAVISTPLGMRITQKPPVISIYDAKGEPLLTLEHQRDSAMHRLAYNGKRLVIADSHGVFLYDLKGNPPKKFAPKLIDKKKQSFLPFFSPDGNELWLVKRRRGEILRYRL